MPTGYEIQMYRDIAAIRLALEKIAASLEKLTEKEEGE